MIPFSLNIHGQIHFFDRPLVMGIVNITPDSFYSQSTALTDGEIEERVEKAVSEGADIIDIGAYSTRPGAAFVSESEERKRLERGLRIARRLAPRTLISVDTFRSEIASFAVRHYGCDIVNDVSGGMADERMAATVASLKVPYVLTHSRGLPAESGVCAESDDFLPTTLRELHSQYLKFVEAGVSDIIIDPGIGFGKTLSQNYEVLRHLETFRVFKSPLLLGVSRKSLITKLLSIDANDSLCATTALNAFCLDRGCDILRVHDVLQARQCVVIYERLRTPQDADGQPDSNTDCTYNYL